MKNKRSTLIKKKIKRQLTIYKKIRKIYIHMNTLSKLNKVR